MTNNLCLLVSVGNWWIENKMRDDAQGGQIKLSLHYTRGTFSVMIHHARGLPKVANAQEPNTYVKVYLKPDPTKATKRKTKVVKKNCHPSFMEMVRLSTLISSTFVIFDCDFGRSIIFSHLFETV